MKQKTPRPTLILSPLARSGSRHDDNAKWIYSDLPQAFAAAGSVCAVESFPGLDQAQARAEMLAVFYEQEEFEDALFVDSDVTTAAAFVLKMATLETELLACAYEDRMPDPGLVHDGGTSTFLVDTAGTALPEIREGMRMMRIRGTGLGLTRIRRSAVKKLIDKAREDADKAGVLFTAPFWTSHLAGIIGLEVCGLFETIVHEHPEGSGVRRRRPEDLSFFHRCHLAGIECWCPLEVPVLHGGKGGRSVYDAMVEEQRLREARALRVSFELVSCPNDLVAGCAHVLDGAYDVAGLELAPGEVVLDIGANIGSFAVWAARRFPGCILQCYEPFPANLEDFRANVEGRVAPSARLHACAVVGAQKSHVTIYPGVANRGEATIYPRKGLHDESAGVVVPAVSARELPPCAVLKCDIEGAECEVLENYPHWDGVKAVMVEWHSFEDYRRIYKFLMGKGFPHAVVDRTRGQAGLDRELCFVRPEAMKRASGSNGLHKQSDSYTPHAVEGVTT